MGIFTRTELSKQSLMDYVIVVECHFGDMYAYPDYEKVEMFNLPLDQIQKLCKRQRNVELPCHHMSIDI